MMPITTRNYEALETNLKVLEAVRVYLDAMLNDNNRDLIARWSPAIETQVNVSSKGGEPVAGKRSTWADEVGNTWWNIRCPKDAQGIKGEPHFKDYELTFPLELRAEGIGCTGWDWRAKRSRWAAFDFDSITTHAKGVGIDDEKLEEVKQAACRIPWIEVRKSTGGSGIHLYTYFELDEEIANHTEHAALARCILALMSSETGFDFASQIDAVGGIMWIWHRKMTVENEGLKILKQAERSFTADLLPANWRDHIEVVQRKRSKVRVNGIDQEHQESWEALASSRTKVPLDVKHKAFIDALQAKGVYTTLWISDYHLLQTHTHAIKDLFNDPQATKDLSLQGLFDTNRAGRDPGSPNCFLFPMTDGTWRAFRFSPGTVEATPWSQDGKGWTTCYVNRPPSLLTAAKLKGGMEDPDKIGEFVFKEAETALEAASLFGAKIDLMGGMMKRATRLEGHQRWSARCRDRQER